jgi:hypothetical protein
MVPPIATPEGRPQVGHAARQAGNLPLKFFWKGGLHHVGRRREHDAQSHTDEEQPRGELPGAPVALHHRHQDNDSRYGDHKPVRIRLRCWNLLARRPAASDDNKMPILLG